MKRTQMEQNTEISRQTGRTTRIVGFVSDQLFSVGECIATDHSVFEYGKVSRDVIKQFIEKVEREISFRSSGRRKVEWKLTMSDGYQMVHFKLI